MTMRSRRRLAWAIAALISTLLLVSGCGRLDTAAPAGQASAVAPPETARALTQVAYGATKEAYVRQEREARATVLALTPTLPRTATPKPTPEPTPGPTWTPELGLRFDCDSIFTAARKLAEISCWQELQGERFYYITTGFAINQVWVSADRAENQDLDQGMLAFYVYNRVSDEQEAAGVFATPARDGPITIQSVIFPRVYVQTKRGTLLTFNLETLQWEDAHAP